MTDIESLYAAFTELATGLEREAELVAPSKAAEIKFAVAARIRQALTTWEETL